MEPTNLTEKQIWNRYEEGRTDLESLIGPLVAIAENSPSLIRGYGVPDSRKREAMIPYFHVCGGYTDRRPVRALILGGWHGQDVLTPCTIARLLAIVETRLAQTAGIEITAYPISNLRAHRDPPSATSEAICWQGSSEEHIQVIERELLRYEYDLVLLLQEDATESHLQGALWPTKQPSGEITKKLLEDYQQTNANFKLTIVPNSNSAAPKFTSIPESDKNPSELHLTLPAALPAAEAISQTLELVLHLLHELWKARLESKF